MDRRQAFRIWLVSFSALAAVMTAGCGLDVCIGNVGSCHWGPLPNANAKTGNNASLTLSTGGVGSVVVGTPVPVTVSGGNGTYKFDPMNGAVINNGQFVATIPATYTITARDTSPNPLMGQISVVVTAAKN